MQVIKQLSYGPESFRLAGDSDDAYFQAIEQQMAHNDFLLPVMKHHLSAGSVILDIGANVGLVTVLAALVVPGAKIISVEPSPAFDHLLDTARLNGLRDHRAVRCCVGAKDGYVSFAVSADNTSASHISLSGTATADSGTPMRSVDSLVAELDLQRLDLIKIDVEGHETGVLEGLQETDRRFEPLIFMEFNSFALTAYANVSPLSLLLRVVSDYGCFVTKDGDRLRRIATPSDVLGFLHANMLQHGCVDDILFTRSNARLSALQA